MARSFLVSPIDAPAQAVFDWLTNPRSFARLIPPWMQVHIVSREGEVSDIGSKITMKVKVGPIWIKWVMQHVAFAQDHAFTDVQMHGPFAFWKHAYRLRLLDANRCELEDSITFSFPFSLINRLIKKRVGRFLSWRHRRIDNEMRALAQFPTDSLKLLVSGSSGFIGSALCHFLEAAGHKVYRLVRHPVPFEENTVVFHPAATKDLEGFDGVIHLAGEPIANGWWTKKKKNRLWSSRCEMTRQLAAQLTQLKKPPKVFIGASAIGIYGPCPVDPVTEESSSGEGFLADLCKAWEAASGPLESVGARRVLARFGLVLSPQGGVLKKVLPSYRMGFGAVVGSKQQWISWIGLDDVVYGLYHLLLTENASGGVNMVAPSLESNVSFARKLGKALHRPVWLTLPDQLLKRVFGQMAEQVLLSSQKVLPQKLTLLGYRFYANTLDELLRELF